MSATLTPAPLLYRMSTGICFWEPNQLEAGLLEAGVAALLHTNADGVQAQQGMGQVGRPLLRLRPRKLQDRQRLAQRLQLVRPAVNVSVASDRLPQQRTLCSSLHALQHTDHCSGRQKPKPLPQLVGMLYRKDDIHTPRKPATLSGSAKAQMCNEHAESEQQLTCRGSSCEAWFPQQSQRPRLGQLPAASPWAPQRPPGPAWPPSCR